MLLQQQRLYTYCLLALTVGAGCLAIPQPCGRKDVLCWLVQLTPDQCSSPNDSPCYNIYAISQSTGVLNWYAYTTSSNGIKAMSVGRRAVYYTTWSGPGLYTINAGTGHVRWQFPLDNWFRYWVKDIDLPPSASFSYAKEVKDLVYVTAPGPPSRLYGLRAKGGSRQWEFKSPVASAVLADLAGPDYISRTHEYAVFLAYNVPASSTVNSSSWLQAVDIHTGSSVWQSQALKETQLERVQLYRTVLATSTAGDAVLAFNRSSGEMLWRHSGRFCSTPSPVAETYADQLLLLRSCSGPLDIAIVGAETGILYWDDWEIPGDAVPTGNCTFVSVKDSSVIFGCSCDIKPQRRQDGSSSSSSDSSAGFELQQEPLNQQQAIRSISGGTADMHGLAPPADRYPSTASVAAAAAAETKQRKDTSGPGVCLYSTSMRSGKLQWVLPQLHNATFNATFPATAQTWGMRPLLHQGLAIFLAESHLIAVDAYWGNLSWVLQLPPGDVLMPWQLPVLDPVTHTLLLTPQRASNKTAVTAVSTKNGKVLWRRTVNGTAQPPSGLVAGAEQLWISGGRVYVESCRGRTCCLRALDMTTGRQNWGVCLDAERGEDATHPHAQFAIWVITLVTIGSIGLLIIGACLLYVHRWSEERRILDGEESSGSPRHTYRPLPDRGDGSDSEADEAERYRAARGAAVVPVAAYRGLLGHIPFVQRPVVHGVQPQPGAQLYAGAPRVGAPVGRGGRLQGDQGSEAGPGEVVRATDAHAIRQHLEAVWVQERGAISGLNRARVAADDEPHQPDSD